MLFGHSANSHVGSDDHHAVVRHQPHEPEHRCLEVLLVAAQIQESQNFLGVGGDMGPSLILRGGQSFWLHHFIAIETHDLLANARSSSVVLLVCEIEDLGSGRSSPVIRDSLGQDSNERRLAAVDVSNDGNSEVRFLPDRHGALEGVELALESLPFFSFLFLRQSAFLIIFEFFFGFLLGFHFGVLEFGFFDFGFGTFGLFLGRLLGVH
mmetsp:Transcript_22407/g.34662  ORF Transcript_22407/g.34662 Transcript_22407/m.34662 type:complete len:209 (+) Transcript_22407:1136-1762(+)